MVIEEQNKRLNEQKDTIIEELTTTIEYLHNKLLEYENGDAQKSAEIDIEANAKIEEQLSEINYLKEQLEYANIRYEKQLERNNELNDIITSAGKNSAINTSKQIHDLQSEVKKARNNMKLAQSRFDKIRTYLMMNGMADVFNKALEVYNVQDTTNGTVSKTKQTVTNNVNKQVNNVNKPVGKKTNAEDNKGKTVKTEKVNSTEKPIEHLAVSIGDILSGFNLDCLSEEDSNIKKDKQSTSEKELPAEPVKKTVEVLEKPAKPVKKTVEVLEKPEENKVVKSDISTQLVAGYNYDYETRVFWLDNSVDKTTHLQSVPSIEREACIDSNLELAGYHIEVEDGKEDELIKNKYKFNEAFKKDIVNNGAILQNGLLDTSGLLMMDEENSRETISNIIDTLGGTGLPVVVSLALFYDSVVRKFTTDELVKQYGLDGDIIKDNVSGLVNLFKAKQLTVHKKYLSVDAVCWIDSSLNKEKLTDIDLTLAKLYKLYIDGYGINELINVFEAEKYRKTLTSYLIKKKVYKKLDENMDLYFRKDCFNTSLSEAVISSMYDVPELMCRHTRNMYNRYYSIIGR